MCNFLSAIVKKNGDLLCNPWTDNHEDLIQLGHLNDTRDGNFARVEFRPEDEKDLDQPNKYVLRIDEDRKPEWFTKDMEKKTASKMKHIIEGMIISGDATGLCGGVFILAKGAKVSWIKNVRIYVMMPESNVGVMWESSKVGVMWESSKVGVMWESSNVGVMWESSKVGVMWESSNVGVMRESSKVGEDKREKKS